VSYALKKLNKQTNKKEVNRGGATPLGFWAKGWLMAGFLKHRIRVSF
jgi:hypothetical protein